MHSVSTSSDGENISAGLRKVLNRHGFGFQYAVLRTIENLVREHSAPWTFEVAEFPVEVKGVGTRIDFIFKHRTGPWQIVGECKRANPALARWAFARAPYARSGRNYEPYFAERVWRDDTGFWVSGIEFGYPDKAYQIAVELKTGDQGETTAGSRQAIEDAASQVIRQVSGLVEFYGANQHLLPLDKPAVFVPVIFTTADLWVTDMDLRGSDVQSGALPASGGVQKVDWLPLQYHLSPGVRHQYRPRELGRTLGAVLDAEYIRTIALVSPAGITAFLEWLQNR